MHARYIDAVDTGRLQQASELRRQFDRHPALDVALKLAVLSAVNLTVNTLWLGIGATFSSTLRNPRTGRALNWTFAGLLLASVVATVVR